MYLFILWALLFPQQTFLEYFGQIPYYMQSELYRMVSSSNQNWSF